MGRRVVITGLGPVSPIGIGKEEFWESIKRGKVGIDRITTFIPDNFKSQVGGEVKDFKVRDYVPKSYRKSTKVMARDIELAVAAADCAVRDAGLRTKAVDPENTNVDPTRVGVNIGAGLICADLNELAYALYSARDEDGNFSLKKWGEVGMNNLTPLWLLKYLPNMLACHVTIIHDAQAPSNTITCGEASSHLAVGEAYRTIIRNSADVILCGGAESKINPMGLLRQDIMGRLTRTHNDSPQSAVRPFDKDRDGTAIAEGGAVIVLEELNHARSRSAEIYAEIIGTGSAFSTENYLQVDAEGKGISLAIKRAIEDAKIEVKDVDVVVALGIGTRVNDLVEAGAIRSILGDDVPVVSIRGQLGNAGAGSGSWDLVVSASMVKEGFVPKTVNCDSVDPDCKVNVVREPISREVNTVLSIGYSLSGGQVGVIVLRRFTE